MSTDIKIWSVNDVEWWIGAGTAETILAAYMDATGCTHEEATGDADELPIELLGDDLDRLKFTDTDEDERPTGQVRTFREQLAIETAGGVATPRLFACTEF